MDKVTLQNISKYNFKLTIERHLEHNRSKGDHQANYDLLVVQLDNIINIIGFLGSEEEGNKLLKKLRDLIEFKAFNAHKPSKFYEIYKKFNNNYDNNVKLTYELIEAVKNQVPCERKCCI